MKFWFRLLLLLSSFMRARFAFGSFYKSKKTKIFYKNNFLFLSQANFQLFGVQTLWRSSFDAFRCISNWSWMTINSPKLISKSSTRRSLKRIFWSLKPHQTKTLSLKHSLRFLIQLRLEISAALSARLTHFWAPRHDRFPSLRCLCLLHLIDYKKCFSRCVAFVPLFRLWFEIISLFGLWTPFSTRLIVALWTQTSLSEATFSVFVRNTSKFRIDLHINYNVFLHTLWAYFEKWLRNKFKAIKPPRFPHKIDPWANELKIKISHLALE